MTKGQMEAAITEALTRFERDYLGRGPQQARSVILGDVILVRLAGILSPAERELSQEPGGVELLKRMRSRLIESSGERLKHLVNDITGEEVLGMHTDISSRSGERIFLFTLATDLEEKLNPIN